MIKEYVTEQMLDRHLEIVGELKRKAKLQKNLRKLLEVEQKNIDREFDYFALSNYILDQFLDEAFDYLIKIGNDKTRKKDSIIEVAKYYAKANNECSVKGVTKLIDRAIQIVENHYYEHLDSEWKVSISTITTQTEELVTSGIKNVIQESESRIISEINKMEKPQNQDFALDEYIKQQRKIVKNYSIFPWFSSSLKYREVFPKLFINPQFEVRSDKYYLDDLLSMTDKNCAILGNAGAGKTTLLRFLFAFEKVKNTKCVYLTAREARDDDGTSDLDRIILWAHNSKQKVLVLIDGIDEEFYNDYSGFEKLIYKINHCQNCHFWLGCRTDFYEKNYSDNIAFSHINYSICPWDSTQAEQFIIKYSEVMNNPRLSELINKVADKKSLQGFKSNPFQLAMLAFLAENDTDFRVNGIYDLYERFMQKWIDREIKRETSQDDFGLIVKTLQTAAQRVYNNEYYCLDGVAEKNTAIKDLLIIEKYVDLNNRRYASAFYHRSLAAFILAQKVFNAMIDDDVEGLKSSFSEKLKDDVTNFIGAKISTLSVSQKKRISEHLEELYDKTPDKIENLSIKEQLVYFVTRLGVDVSDFLVKIVQHPQNNRIMRLTIAYGCVLSDAPEARSFALQYAKSIASGSIDAITNRAWTVVYFGDVVSVNGENANPYNYMDEEHSSWKNARAARIKRFTNKHPRLKDYRFRLFDIPLFLSFLRDRNWNDLSQKEYEILERVEIPEGIFSYEEIEFLTEQKTLLLQEYKMNLLERVQTEYETN